MVKKMEITQHQKYTCTFCGKVGAICDPIMFNFDVLIPIYPRNP